MNHNVRKLTDGAMMAAILGVLILIDRWTGGFFEGTAVFLLPLPMVFYAARYGIRDSWAVLAAICILCIVLGTPQALFYMASESFIGMVYGDGIHRGTGTSRLLIRSMALGAIADTLSMVVFASFFGYDMAGSLAQIKDVFNQIGTQMGVSFNAIMNLDSLAREIFILAAVLSGMLEGFVTHMLSRIMLKRLHYPLPPSAPLRDYYPPKWTGYVALAGVLAYFYAMRSTGISETVQAMCMGLGLAGYYYLDLFAVIGLTVWARARNPHISKWIALPIVMLVMIMSMLGAMFGFVYISTDMHQSMLAGRNQS